MATRCSLLAQEIPWIEEPGRLQSMESQRVRHNWAHNHHQNSHRDFFFFLYIRSLVQNSLKVSHHTQKTIKFLSMKSLPIFLSSSSYTFLFVHSIPVFLQSLEHEQSEFIPASESFYSPYFLPGMILIHLFLFLLLFNQISAQTLHWHIDLHPSFYLKDPSPPSLTSFILFSIHLFCLKVFTKLSLDGGI